MKTIFAVLLTLCLFQLGGAVTGFLGTPTAFTHLDSVINIEDSNNNTILTVSFSVERACVNGTGCYMNIGLLSSVPRGAKTNLPSSSTILPLGSSLQNALALNITLTPLSALLNGTVITIPGFATNSSSYASFVYDSVYGQFGRIQSGGNSIPVPSDYLIPGIFLFATTYSSDPYPLVNSQYYNLAGSIASNLALGNGLYLNVTSTYDNSIRIFYTTSNPVTATAPSGYASAGSYYQIELRNPSGSISGLWKITNSSVSAAVLNSTALGYVSTTGTQYVIPTYSNITRYFVNNTNANAVVQTYDQLLGTWALYNYSGVSSVVPSIMLVVAIFAVLLS